MSLDRCIQISVDRCIQMSADLCLQTDWLRCQQTDWLRCLQTDGLKYLQTEVLKYLKRDILRCLQTFAFKFLMKVIHKCLQTNCLQTAIILQTGELKLLQKQSFYRNYFNYLFIFDIALVFCLKMAACLSFWLGTRFPGSTIISTSGTMCPDRSKI